MLTRIYRQGSGNRVIVRRNTPFPIGNHAFTGKWLDRVEANNGQVSAKSIDVGNRYIAELIRFGLLSNIKFRQSSLGDNLASSLIALINETGVSAADQGTPVNLDDMHYFERGGQDFMWFDGVDDEVVISENLSGDFDLSFDLYPNASLGHVLADDTTNAVGRVFWNNGGARGGDFGITDNNSSFLDFNHSVTLGEWATYRFVRTSGTVELFKDGTSLGTGSLSGDTTFNTVGGKKGSATAVPFLHGSLKNLVIDGTTYPGTGVTSGDWNGATVNGSPIKGFPAGIQKVGNADGYVNLGFSPADIGATGGLGAWVLVPDSVTGTQIMGARFSNADRASLQNNPADIIAVYGNDANLIRSASVSGLVVASRRSDVIFNLWVNGVKTDANTGSDSGPSTSLDNYLLAWNNEGIAQGFSDARLGSALVTDGQIPDDKQATLFQIEQNFQAALGRVFFSNDWDTYITTDGDRYITSDGDVYLTAK